MADGDSPFALHKRRKDRAWTGRSAWDKLYADAYEFAIPQRRPGKLGRPKTQIERLFDMTAPVSTFHFAGQLQQDLFPAGQENFWLKPGAIPKVAASRGTFPKGGLAVLERELHQTSQLIHPFFATGEWDSSMHETCLDLGIGFGGLYVAKGTKDNPLRFVSIPSEDLAVETNMFGDVIFVSWKQELPRQAIDEAFPDGRFPEGWKAKLVHSGDEPVTLCQDFVRDALSGRWKFYAYVDESLEPIARNEFRTRPIATPRYYRVPGEAYGRGPVLLAMPSIKTLNKAQELALKAAAIQMLGIWGYRAGGSFNPDTVRVGPGEFWPMMATGGILGADVQRLDPASGRLDVARLVIGSLQEQIKAVLLDMRLPDPGTTPASASEIVARLKAKKDAHLGAFGRLSREIMPVVVPRAIEILYDFGYLANSIRIDELLISIEVVSPMAQALKADRLTPSLSYVEIVAALAGADRVDEYAALDAMLDRIASDTNVPPDERVLPGAEREKVRAGKAQQQAAQAAAMIAMQAAGAKPDGKGGQPMLPMAA